MKVLYDHATLKDSLKLQGAMHAQQQTGMHQDSSRPRALIKTSAEAACSKHAQPAVTVGLLAP